MKKGRHLIETIGQYLKSSKEAVSVAESVTSGYIQFLLSQITNASDSFMGGITAYTLREKVDLLKIDEQTAKENDCVCAAIAEQMALKVSEMFKTEWGIAVTGYATPVEESNFEIFAYYSIAYRKKIVISERITCKESVAEDAQIFYAKSIVKSFEKQLNTISEH